MRANSKPNKAKRRRKKRQKSTDPDVAGEVDFLEMASGLFKEIREEKNIDLDYCSRSALRLGERLLTASHSERAYLAGNIVVLRVLQPQREKLTPRVVKKGLKSATYGLSDKLRLKFLKMLAKQHRKAEWKRASSLDKTRKKKKTNKSKKGYSKGVLKEMDDLVSKMVQRSLQAEKESWEKGETGKNVKSKGNLMEIGESPGANLDLGDLERRGMRVFSSRQNLDSGDMVVLLLDFLSEVFKFGKKEQCMEGLHLLGAILEGAISGPRDCPLLLEFFHKVIEILMLAQDHANRDMRKKCDNYLNDHINYIITEIYTYLSKEGAELATTLKAILKVRRSKAPGARPNNSRPQAEDETMSRQQKIAAQRSKRKDRQLKRNNIPIPATAWTQEQIDDCEYLIEDLERKLTKLDELVVLWTIQIVQKFLERSSYSERKTGLGLMVKVLGELGNSGARAMEDRVMRIFFNCRGKIVKFSLQHLENQTKFMKIFEIIQKLGLFGEEQRNQTENRSKYLYFDEGLEAKTVRIGPISHNMLDSLIMGNRETNEFAGKIITPSNWLALFSNMQHSHLEVRSHFTNLFLTQIFGEEGRVATEEKIIEMLLCMQMMAWVRTGVPVESGNIRAGVSISRTQRVIVNDCLTKFSDALIEKIDLVVVVPQLFQIYKKLSEGFQNNSAGFVENERVQGPRNGYTLEESLCEVVLLFWNRVMIKAEKEALRYKGEVDKWRARQVDLNEQSVPTQNIEALHENRESSQEQVAEINMPTNEQIQIPPILKLWPRELEKHRRDICQLTFNKLEHFNRLTHSQRPSETTDQDANQPNRQMMYEVNCEQAVQMLKLLTHELQISKELTPAVSETKHLILDFELAADPRLIKGIIAWAFNFHHRFPAERGSIVNIEEKFQRISSRLQLRVENVELRNLEAGDLLDVLKLGYLGKYLNRVMDLAPILEFADELVERYKRAEWDFKEQEMVPAAMRLCAVGLSSAFMRAYELDENRDHATVIETYLKTNPRILRLLVSCLKYRDYQMQLIQDQIIKEENKRKYLANLKTKG